MSNTLTTEVPVGTINPRTGHVDADDVALYRAIGPDQGDPPSTGGTEQTCVPFGWLRPPGGGPLDARRYVYGGNPQGPPAGPFMGYPYQGRGLPGGGPPGRGLPREGPPRGGPPMPLPPAPIIPGGRNDKLVGNTPLIFTGDRTKAEEFITQWQLYEGVNITNDLMRNAYQ
jgi:hypothetical protein